jgi:RsiW-degrading membrane proteinase PrsW (M82 family)
MPQIIQCPKCAKKLSAPDQLAGKQVACPACAAPVSIPALKATTPTQRSPSQPAGAAAKAAATAQPSATRANPSKPGAPQPAAKPAVPPNAAVVRCPHCAKAFTGPVQLNGKTIPCPACNKQFTVVLAPAASATSPAAPAAQPVPARPLPGHPALATRPPLGRPPASPISSTASQKSAAAAKSSNPAAARRFALAGRRPRLLYLLFALAFIPLVLQTLGSQGDVAERLTHTFAAHPEIEPKLESVKSKADLYALFPDGRIEGAHVSYFTHIHWVYAAIAALAFFGVTWFLFDPGKASVPQWVIVFAFTATVGIISLLAFQWMAQITDGVWITGRGIIMLLFYIVKFIGFSYSAASDPDTGFLLSFFGFTFGVGLCEEITKALPVIVWLGEDKKLDWRAACVLGLASGIGFGVVEGIIYAGDHYNGMASADIYITRFVSCVALHATWTAAVALMAVRNLGGFNTSEATEYGVHLLMIISVPAIMHGLYDTLLKKGFEGYALLVALASFAWLAFLLERARSLDEESAPRRAIRVTA